MNDFGMMLAWIAVRVSIVMIPTAALYAIASRRSPISGAWIAAMGLAITIALTLWGTFPDSTVAITSATKSQELNVFSRKTGQLTNTFTGGPNGARGSVAGSSGAGMNPRSVFDYLSRVERRSAMSASRFRSWGWSLAMVSLAGSMLGLVQLGMGLWALSLCRRRGALVDHEKLLQLMRSLRWEMAIPREVELREVADLATPATAGWLSPLIMLPEDWSSWSDDECRAVLAHELAHIKRGDYGLGLLARVAVILNFYHPAVRWLSTQLQFQQELAADAIGAEFAGGRGVYLRALSSLALRQEGRISQGPARAFLPVRGTLIRRIAMLRIDENASARPFTVRGKFFASLVLLTAAVCVGLLRTPARADGPPSVSGDVKPVAVVKRESDNKSFDLSYVAENATGFVAIRPSALFKRSGMAKFASLFNTECHKVLTPIAKGIGRTLPEAENGPLRIEMIEEASCSLKVETIPIAYRPKPTANGHVPKHRLITHTLMVRTIEPFDWVKLAREWKLEPTEVNVGDRKYYRLGGKLAAFLGPNGGFFCPDDRTIVFDNEKHLVELLSRDKSFSSPYLRAEGWNEVGRGLLAIALDNRNDNWTKDLVEIGDEYKLPVNNVDYWLGVVSDGDPIALKGIATCRNASSAEDLVKSFDGLLSVMKLEAAKRTPRSKFEPQFNLYKSLFDHVRVSHDVKAVTIRSQVDEKLSVLVDLLSQTTE